MKTILVIFVLALSLNAQTLATVNNQEIKVEDVNNFLKSTDQNMDYNKLDNKAKNLTLHQTIEKTLLIQEAQKTKREQGIKTEDKFFIEMGDEPVSNIMWGADFNHRYCWCSHTCNLRLFNATF